jgi:hypothetical protein
MQFETSEEFLLLFKINLLLLLSVLGPCLAVSDNFRIKGGERSLIDPLLHGALHRKACSISYISALISKAV